LTRALRACRGFVDEQLVSSEPDLTVDEVLARWDYETRTEEEREDTLEAILEGLADMHARRTRPAESALREQCRKHGLPEPR
jgi:hypothetical protein